jgi:hypothetical protein
MGGVDSPIKGGEKDETGFVFGFQHGNFLFRCLATLYGKIHGDDTARADISKVFRRRRISVQVSAPPLAASVQSDRKETVPFWRSFIRATPLAKKTASLIKKKN